MAIDDVGSIERARRFPSAALILSSATALEPMVLGASGSR